jgi:hypothetical protein
MQFVRRALAAPPPVVAAAVLVVLQLLAAVALAHGQGWGYSHRDEALAGCLLAVEIILLYAVALEIAGRIFALGATLLFIVAPVILAKRYFILGGGGIDYRTVYRHDVLPTVFGLTARAGIGAACLLLASAWLVLARTTRAPRWLTMGLGGAAAAGAALVDPHVWPALAAPVVAAAWTRRPAVVGAAVASAGLGLVALVVFRNAPHVPLGWHRMGITLDSVREYSWSRRILEYLPLGGFVGLARRWAPAAAFCGAAVLATVIFPLARQINLTQYLLVIVPGLPVYWLLAASIPFLVPHTRRSVSPSPVSGVGDQA